MLAILGSDIALCVSLFARAAAIISNCKIERIASFAKGLEPARSYSIVDRKVGEIIPYVYPCSYDEALD